MADDAMDFEWPRRFRQFFHRARPRRKSAHSREFAAFLEWHEEMRDSEQDRSFLLAADNLVRDLLMQSELKQFDSKREFYGLVYPILYCYRHYLELGIKGVIRLYQRVTRNRASVDAVANGHNLHKLWECAKSLMDEHNQPPTRNSAEVRFVDELVKTFHDVDIGSTVFRYAHDKRGRRTRSGIPAADLRALMKNMRELDAYFTAQADVVWLIEQAIENADY